MSMQIRSGSCGGTGARGRGVIKLWAVWAGCVTAAACAAAHGQVFLRPIATEIESAPSLVPTVPPTPLDALLQSKISASRSGDRWAAEVFIVPPGATSGTTQAAVSGGRTGVDFALAIGATIPGLGVALASGPSGIDERVLVDQAGNVYISGDLTGATTSDELILRWNRADGSYSVLAREGSPIGATVPGEAFGGSMFARTVLADGRVAFYNSGTVGSLASSLDDFLFISGPAATPLAQVGVLTPTGQAGGGSLVVNAFQDDFGVSADGSRWILIGLLNRAANRQVAIVNGAVVLEQGLALPGPATPLSVAALINDVRMSPGGRWAAWGRGDETSTMWIVVDGQRIASADEGFPGGLAGETLISITDAGFTTRGDFWFAGTTTLLRSVIMVLPAVPGAAPIQALASGDLVDFDANGDPLNDLCQVTSIFSADLADDGTLYVITRNSGPQSAFQFDIIGTVPVALPSACRADFDADGTTTVSDIFAFLAAWFASDPRADIDASGDRGVNDIFAFLSLWFAGCP